MLHRCYAKHFRFTFSFTAVTCIRLKNNQHTAHGYLVRNRNASGKTCPSISILNSFRSARNTARQQCSAYVCIGTVHQCTSSFDFFFLSFFLHHFFFACLRTLAHYHGYGWTQFTIYTVDVSHFHVMLSNSMLCHFCHGILINSIWLIVHKILFLLRQVVVSRYALSLQPYIYAQRAYSCRRRQFSYFVRTYFRAS